MALSVHLSFIHEPSLLLQDTPHRRVMSFPEIVQLANSRTLDPCCALPASAAKHRSLLPIYIECRVTGYLC